LIRCALRRHSMSCRPRCTTRRRTAGACTRSSWSTMSRLVRHPDRMLTPTDSFLVLAGIHRLLFHLIHDLDLCVRL
jgi:hypothetical protein